MSYSISQVSSYNRCKRRWHYRYVQGLKRKSRDVKLEKGILVHECLEKLYLKEPWQDVIQNYEKKISHLLEEEQYEYRKIMLEAHRIMSGYINFYRYEDDIAEVLAVELPFDIETPDGNQYEGRIDLIYRDHQGFVWVCDHKTTKTVPTDTFRYFDSQTNLYFYVAQKLGYNPMGVVFNYLRTKAPTQPKILKNGTVSKADIDTDFQTYMNTVRVAGLNPEDYADMEAKLSGNVFFKRVRVPRPNKLVENILIEFDASVRNIKQGVEVTRSMNMNCTWDCEFCELCFAELSGTNAEYILDANYDKEERRNDSTETESTEND